MTEKKQQLIFKIILLFILLQPLLDILSRGAILGYIPRISTYLKPLFVFGLTGYLLLLYSPKKKRWLFYIFIFGLLVIVHTYLLYKLLLDTETILHEFRFLINIAYMLALYISLDTLYYYSQDKEEMYRQIKRTILYTFIIYFGLYLLSIITGTSSMTYEIADKNKLGFKGWYDSGQILGHAYSVMLPLLMYVTLDPKRKWYYRALIILLFIVSISLLGTRVPYFITMIVLILYLIITIFIKIFNKEHMPNYFNILFVFMMIIGLFLTYKYTPVKYNIDLNNQAASTKISLYNLDVEAGYEEVDPQKLQNMYPGKDITQLLEYNTWANKSSDHLKELFESGKVHPSNMRLKQIRYASYKYRLASFKYKTFGLGFLNQNDSLALESDFTMALFSFGLLGLILFLILPIKEFIVMTIYIFRNLKLVDLETYMLYMGLGIFFCISIYAGYTYIYTNFSIFLILLIMMLKIKREVLKKTIIKENKISFLLLHLGYGGIETAVINTANELVKEYDVELVSLYNLKNNQVSRINSNISIKYLYNGEPNKKAFLESLHEHRYLNMIKEGIKATVILILKKLLIIHEIRNSDSKYLVSTRYDFSVLLSKYGSSVNIKIAEEHHYHNNNKKYINILKNKYYNIDYLFALTKTLYDDYHDFLKNNTHTKIVLMPNMLSTIPNKKSKLDKCNLITMSRLDYGKKNDDIIKAFAKIKNKNWKLYILGDGNEYDNLLSLVKELKLTDRVILTGYIKKEDLEKYLLDSSIFLMASLTEGLPMVLLEAMSYGIPCIAYETASGVNDIIKDGYNGYVIKDRNEAVYVGCLDKLTTDDKLRHVMGANALKTVDKFTADEIIKKWHRVIRGEINEKE